MSARKTLLMTLLVLATLGRGLDAASVSWISGDSGPKSWGISPDEPSIVDVVTFSGPTNVFSNSCDAERTLGGTPRILVDQELKLVLLWFQGPGPQICPEAESEANIGMSVLASEAEATTMASP